MAAPTAAPSDGSAGATDSATAACTSQQAWSFSVMCYNILADTYAHHFASKLYRDVPRRCLEWPARRSLLLAEIRYWAPDVVCLQEVQHYRDLEQEMAAAGYEGRFMRRTGRRRDGCATFWRSDRLRAVWLQRLEFAPLGLDDNVAMLLNLAPRPEDAAASQLDSHTAEALSSVRLLIATTHITFDPAKGDVKLGQVRELLTRAAALAAQPPPEEPEPPRSPGPASAPAASAAAAAAGQHPHPHHPHHNHVHHHHSHVHAARRHSLQEPYGYQHRHTGQQHRGGDGAGAGSGEFVKPSASPSSPPPLPHGRRRGSSPPDPRPAHTDQHHHQHQQQQTPDHNDGTWRHRRAQEGDGDAGAARTASARSEQEAEAEGGGRSQSDAWPSCGSGSGSGTASGAVSSSGPGSASSSGSSAAHALSMTHGSVGPASPGGFADASCGHHSLDGSSGGWRWTQAHAQQPGASATAALAAAATGARAATTAAAAVPPPPPRQTLAIITGDFNSTAGSPLYQFVARGSLDLSATSRKKLSGQLHGVCHTQYKPISEVQQLHAKHLAATAAAAASTTAATAVTPAATDATDAAAVTATACDPAPTPVAKPAAAGDGAAAAAAKLTRQLSARLLGGAAAAGGGGNPGGHGGGGGGGPLGSLFSALQRSVFDRWSERELRAAMGPEQYARACGAGGGGGGAPSFLFSRGSMPARLDMLTASLAGSLAPLAESGTETVALAPAGACSVAGSGSGSGTSRRPIGRLHSVTASSLASRVGAAAAASAAASAAAADAAATVTEPGFLTASAAAAARAKAAKALGQRRSLDACCAAYAAAAAAAACGGGDAPLVVRHPLRLRSSYVEVAAAEPAFTSIHSGFAGTVDFIWYTDEAIQEGLGTGGGAAAAPCRCGLQTAPQPAEAAAEDAEEGAAEGAVAQEHPPHPRFALVPVAVLQPPEIETLPRGLPAGGWGSDHISIMTRFELRPVH